MIDSHCHLLHERFSAEVPSLEVAALVDRARAAGVTRLVHIACERPEWSDGVALAARPS